MKFNPVITNKDLREMNLKFEHYLAQDSITHDQAKEYLLGKRGNPCREQVESISQYAFTNQPV